MSDEPRRPDDFQASDLPVPESLADLQADENLIQSLQRFETRPGDDALARMVLAWRRDIESEPLPVQPDLFTAESALATVQRPAHRRRLLTPVTAAAAVVGIALSGVALLAHDARPGDTLWGVTQVVYAEHAKSVVAADQAQSDLQVAAREIRAGSPAAAAEALSRAGEALRSVGSGEGRELLATLYVALSAQVAHTGAPAVPAPAPPSTTPPSPATTTTPPDPTTSTTPGAGSSTTPPRTTTEPTDTRGTTSPPSPSPSPASPTLTETVVVPPPATVPPPEVVPAPGTTTTEPPLPSPPPPVTTDEPLPPSTILDTPAAPDTSELTPSGATPSGMTSSSTATTGFTTVQPGG
ncbi:hypothetical protein [Rhodococcus sp. X156]|uniref:hypothetical protein n=1 Tax=Rhodococcus sp. X156 TaxID=2499145 RepID=UPI000FD91588|nr:hypothetical protein [Rhodococcus sp. X156]